MMKLDLTLKALMDFITKLLKFCVYAATGALCMSIGISDLFNDKFARIGLEGVPLQVCRVVVFGLLTGLFFNAMLRQLPKKYQ